MNPTHHTCDCGFVWLHGHSGSHECGPYYRKTIAGLRKKLAAQADRQPAMGAAALSDEASRQNMELVVARLEQIAGNFSADYREDAEQALVCARAVLANRPTASGTMGAGNRIEELRQSLISLCKRQIAANKKDQTTIEWGGEATPQRFLDVLQADRAPASGAGDLSDDSARMDFIERHPEMKLHCHKKRWSFMPFTNYEYDVFKTLREAIDAARAATGEKGGAA